MEELLKVFEENRELGDKIKAMWSEGASAKEIADALTKAGLEIDTEQIEGLLAMLQAERAKTIGDGERVDADQLKAVAGGTDCGFSYSSGDIPNGAHLGKCSYVYLKTECDATVEQGSWCWSNDACVTFTNMYRSISCQSPAAVKTS